MGRGEWPSNNDAIYHFSKYRRWRVVAVRAIRIQKWLGIQGRLESRWGTNWKVNGGTRLQLICAETDFAPAFSEILLLYFNVVVSISLKLYKISFIWIHCFLSINRFLNSILWICQNEWQIMFHMVEKWLGMDRYVNSDTFGISAIYHSAQHTQSWRKQINCITIPHDTATRAYLCQWQKEMSI